MSMSIARFWYSNVFERLPNADSLLPSLQYILASNKTDEEISVEAAELLGFENIELVTEVISKRRDAMNRLNRILNGHDAPRTHSTRGRGARRGGHTPRG